MFRRLPDASGEKVTISLNGKTIVAWKGDTVAAALLAAGCDQFRKSAVGAVPRGPYCLMGVCFECLVTIDGVRNRQACMIPVTEGMRVETGDSLTEAAAQ
jgi:NADH dehydrogenase/NADH:ubiquinone oxidoreductase subunit G